MIVCVRILGLVTLDVLLEHLMELTSRIEVVSDRGTTANRRPLVNCKLRIASSEWRIRSGELRVRSCEFASCHSPLATRYSPPVLYLDLSDLDWPAAVVTVQRIGQVMREQLHLTPAIGLARGKFTARVAAAVAAPNEALLIASGHEAAFLAPFPVDLLPMGEETARRLRLLGIRTLGQLAALPVGAVLTQLGKEGRLLHRLAQGRDDRPVLPWHPEVVERVAHPFDDPVADGFILQAVIRSMAQELATRLRSKGYMARRLTLIIRLEDGTTCEDRLILRRPSAGAEHIAQTLCDLLARTQISCGVVELEVALADLIPSQGQQLDLFVPQTGQEHRLQEVLKDLVARYGTDCFYRISLTDREARLPEHRFRLLTAEGWGLKAER